jgi:ATP-dependent DNA helicase RecQ
MTADDNWLKLLKQYFGFTSFRPLQKEIITDVLAGNDVFALLPTGGGKSLCFQLPALTRPGLVLVISPLIALMKDQVDALQASGIAATFLNSSLDAGESRERLRKLRNGEFRLLYVAPERVMLDGFLRDLREWNINLIAIDEAHCISEWGHDFRPEYRRISQLRDLFPSVPFLALTATATTRVRDDIVTQLKLRQPSCYVASFNRPNLTYRVFPKAQPVDQIVAFLRSRPHESGIIYCQSRKTTESVAAKLSVNGIVAKPYHAGLSSEERSRHQELFLRDEVTVICATIAFGMGINKPNVRFVIHHDLPKNVEGYYQETGRAGRDGLPGECHLYFSAGDVVKYEQFIAEKPEQEQLIARQQLQQITHYADSSSCRRSALLDYFGEKFPDDNCGGCDNCLAPRETFDGTLAAQKFLSCVYRIWERNTFNMGFNHVVTVLTGGDTEAVRKWGHEKLSTFGIGTEHKKPEWQAIGRELIRLGYLRQTTDKFSVVELTEQGRAALRERRKITLTKPAAPAEQRLSKVGDIRCDEVLFDKLRDLRKRVADERNVPAYIVFSDVSLRQMARYYPTELSAFSRISGVGQKKLDEFGQMFMREIANFLSANPKQIFADDSFTQPVARPVRTIMNETTAESLRLFRGGNKVSQIAEKRGFAMTTIYGHLANAIEAGESFSYESFFTPAEREEIGAAFAKFGFGNITGVRETLGEKYDYGVLRIYRAIAQHLAKIE